MAPKSAKIIDFWREFYRGAVRNEKSIEGLFGFQKTKSSLLYYAIARGILGDFSCSKSDTCYHKLGLKPVRRSGPGDRIECLSELSPRPRSRDLEIACYAENHRCPMKWWTGRQLFRRSLYGWCWSSTPIVGPPIYYLKLTTRGTENGDRSVREF